MWQAQVIWIMQEMHDRHLQPNVRASLICVTSGIYPLYTDKMYKVEKLMVPSQRNFAVICGKYGFFTGVSGPHGTNTVTGFQPRSSLDGLQFVTMQPIGQSVSSVICGELVGCQEALLIKAKKEQGLSVTSLARKPA